MAVISVNNLFAQSPYLNLMAAGSDGTDGSAPGIHLRWHLLGDIGEKHLPKGELASDPNNILNYTSAGYNRPDDFVYIYRTEYTKKYPVEVFFQEQLVSSNQLKESGSKRQWIFSDLIPIPEMPNEKCTFTVLFTNINKYDSVRLLLNPVNNAEEFLKRYNDVLEVVVDDQLLFSAEIISGNEWLSSNNSTEVYDLKFNGSNQFVTLPYNGFNYENDFTIEVNIILQGNDNGGVIVSQSSVNLTGGFVFAATRETISIQFGTTDIYSQNFSSELQNDTLHHVAISRQGQTVKFYLDGIQQGDETNLSATNLAVDSNIILGKGQISSGFNDFKGVLKHFRMWNTSRSESDLMSYRFGSLSSHHNGLIVWYKLEDGHGQFVIDVVSNMTTSDYNPGTNIDPLVPGALPPIYNGFLGSSNEEDGNDPKWELNSSPFLGMTKIETIVREENLPESPFLIDCRKTFINRFENVLLHEASGYILLEDSTFILLEKGDASRIVNKVTGENISRIRFRTFGSEIKGVRIETYKHFLLGTNQQLNGSGGWEQIDKFSLSLNDNEVFDRLEKPGLYDVHNKWPKFNKGAKVNVNNYHQRWNQTIDTNPGLKKGVQYYLENSLNEDNLKAETEIKVTEGEVGTNEIGTWIIGNSGDSQTFIVLDLLNMASTDFHVARMLGLGHIDILSGKPSSKTKKYIYISLYNTTWVNDVIKDSYSHSYMTLGVSKSLQSIPKSPSIELDYGMYALNTNEEKVFVTDKNGYYPEIDLRAINIKLTKTVERPGLGIPEFFVPDIDFCNVEHPDPILFGIDYKKSSDLNWIKPEISHDDYYKDTTNIFESKPVICSSDETTLYTHLETEEGSHDYAAYAINWFSRPSTIGNIVTTSTIFPKKYNLLPPLNLTAQIIQKEDFDALLLTSASEQYKLQQLLDTNPEQILVRVLFNWDDIQNSNYWHSNKVKFVFRKDKPKTLSGQVKSSLGNTIILNDEQVNVIEVRTQSFIRNSVSPAQTITPQIDFATNKHIPFLYGAFAINGITYTIRDIKPSSVQGEGPVFMLEPINTTTKAKDDSGSSTLNMSANTETLLPEVNSNFTVFESLGFPQNWETTLTQEVELKFWDENNFYYETFIEKGSGKEKEVKIGGITRRVKITERREIYKNTEGFDILTDKLKTGVFDFEFDNDPLGIHPDPKVEWYGGTIRTSLIPSSGNRLNGEIRRLDVIAIKVLEGKLIVTAADRLFSVQGEEQSLLYSPIPLGENILINFHPGYKVYLNKESGFDQNSLFNFPTNSEFCDTYLAGYAVEETLNLSSYVSSPIVLRSIKLYEPVKPEKPVGPKFATKPNYFGKSTYNFTTKFNSDNNRKPYAVIYYRGIDQTILETLYKPDTVSQIIVLLQNDDFKNRRLIELVNIEVNSVSKNFKEYAGFALPNPDNDKYRVPYADPNVKIYPFKSSNYSNGIIPSPGSESFVVSNPTLFPYKSSEDWQMINILREAIVNSFVPLTEAPIMYDRIKLSSDGYESRNINPTIRDSNGALLSVTSPYYDPAPMAVIVNENDNIVRFSDFTLDGASNRLFFYCAREMNNNFVMSSISTVLGPVKLINTAPATPPKIRKITSQSEEIISNILPAVLFEINNYIEGEKITKFKIYRSTNEVEAKNVRFMKLARTIEANEEIIDNFSDIDYFPFGEALYYRLVAIREVLVPIQYDEALEPSSLDLPNLNIRTELIESLPSDIAVTNIIDVINPLSPEMSVNIINTTPLFYEDITISWERTTYNGTYYLYKMTYSGNWSKIHSVKTNEETITYNILSLPRKDEENNTLYHRFKITVENSSGLLSISDKEITI